MTHFLLGNIYCTVYTVFVGWSQKTHAAEALGQNTNGSNNNNNKSHRSRSSSALLYNVNTFCPRLPIQHRHKAFQTTTVCSAHLDTVHCLNLLYVWNSHCGRKTKRTTHLGISANFGCETKTSPLTMWCEKTKVLCPPAHSDARHILSEVRLCRTQDTPAWPYEIIKHYDFHWTISSRSVLDHWWIFSQHVGESPIIQVILWVPGVSFQVTVKSSCSISWLNHWLFSTFPSSVL